MGITVISPCESSEVWGGRTRSCQGAGAGRTDRRRNLLWSLPGGGGGVPAALGTEGSPGPSGECPGHFPFFSDGQKRGRMARVLPLPLRHLGWERVQKPKSSSRETGQLRAAARDRKAQICRLRPLEVSGPRGRPPAALGAGTLVVGPEPGRPRADPFSSGSPHPNEGKNHFASLSLSFSVCELEKTGPGEGVPMRLRTNLGEEEGERATAR